MILTFANVVVTHPGAREREKGEQSKLELLLVNERTQKVIAVPVEEKDLVKIIQRSAALLEIVAS